MPTITDYQDNSNAYPLQWMARARSPMAGSLLLASGGQQLVGKYDLWTAFFGGYPVWANLPTTVDTPVSSIAFASVFSALIYTDSPVLVDIKVFMDPATEVSIFPVVPTAPTGLFSLTTGKLLCQYVAVYFQRALETDTTVTFHFQMAEE